MLIVNRSFAYYLICLLYPFLIIAQNRAIDSIPFKLESDNRVYLQLKVNDKDSLNFLFDTGASDMVINSERLNKVKMVFNDSVKNSGTTGVSFVPLSTNNKLQIGNQNISKINFISIPYPNEKWDGVLGLSLLRKYNVKIDYDLMKIYLYDRNKIERKNNNKLKIKYVNNVPTIELEVATIDGAKHKLNVEIDTGSDRIIDISTNYVDSHKLLNVYKKAFATSTITSSDGNQGKIFNVYFTKVKFINYEIYKIPGGLARVNFGILKGDGIDGMIGNSFLKRFNLFFDFENNYLTIEPNNNLHSLYYDFLLKK